MFTLVNATNTDSLGGTYGYITANFTSGLLLQNNQSISLTDPLSTDESGGCYFIKIGQVSLKPFNDSVFEKENTCFYSPDEKYVFVFKNEFAFFSYRCFNHETLSIQYNKQNNQIKLKIIE